MCHNIARKSWTKNTENSDKDKQMDVNNNIVKQIVEIGHATVNYVESKNKTSGGFTKPLNPQLYAKFREYFRVQCLN